MIDLTIKIYSYENAMQIYEDVSLIRLKSKNSSLLIMEDYTPVIGELNGDITFLNSEKEISLHKVRGYYVHKQNTFELILKNAS